jgi:hypothetical protein
VKRRLALVAVAAAAMAGCGGGGSGGEHGGGAKAPAHLTPRPGGPAREQPAPRLDTPALRAQARHGSLVATVLRRTGLLTAPGGERVARIGPRTGYGSQRSMAVAALHGAWIGVRAPERPNGRIGWVAARDVRLLRATWRQDVDLSTRTLTARHQGRARFRIPVAVGSSATPTPTGRFGVTDRLTTGAGSPYGCCILALSGHQPHVPQGWGGGDRIAIHGTANEATIGSAVSGGCLRARRHDLGRLMDVIPIGTTVVIRA